jgi:hypothetical protein
MSSTATRTHEEWATLINLEEEARIEEMAARFTAVNALPDTERDAAIKKIVDATYAMSDEQLHAMTLSRLRSFLRMEEHAAHDVGHAFEKVANELPADQAMRRVMMLQKVGHDMSLEEQAQLRAIVPSALGDAPTNADETTKLPSDLKAEAEAEPEEKRPWWAFWRNN